MAGSTLLYSEILDKVHKAKTKDQKVLILKQNNTEGLRMVIKSSFDPKILWSIPEGEVPFRVNDVPMGTEHTVLAMESKKLWHFIKGADRTTPQHKKEQMFIQMLEGLHESEAKLLIAAKDKKFTKCIKGYLLMSSRKHLIGMTIIRKMTKTYTIKTHEVQVGLLVN